MLPFAPSQESHAKERIEPFMKNLISNYQKAFYPYEDVSIDEMVIKFKSR